MLINKKANFSHIKFNCIKYIVNCIILQYNDVIESKKITSYDRILGIFKDNIVPIDKAFILNKCPDLSETTMGRTINGLLKESKIIKISGGRYTKYKLDI